MIIFGWGAGEAKDLGEVAPATCPNCGNHVFLHHIRSEKRVSLYFIPLVPYGSNEYLACPVCRSGLQLRPENRPTVDRMAAATRAFRRGALAQAAYQARAEDFWRTIGLGPTGAQVVHPTSTIPPLVAAGTPPAGVDAAGTPTDGTSLRERVEGLAKLHAEGVLTDEEFAAAKRRMLDI